VNNKQESNSIDAPSDDASAMHSEIEADQTGDKKVVNRARHSGQNIAVSEFQIFKRIKF